eukprot:scaffold89477_cov27-Tisochrysis_lutea.AAC.8
MVRLARPHIFKWNLAKGSRHRSADVRCLLSSACRPPKFPSIIRIRISSVGSSDGTCKINLFTRHGKIFWHSLLTHPSILVPGV